MQEWYNDVVIILSGASSIVCRELTPAPSGSIRLIILVLIKGKGIGLPFLLLFCTFVQFCALVCKIGFLFFNFPCFCTIDHGMGLLLANMGDFYLPLIANNSIVLPIFSCSVSVSMLHKAINFCNLAGRNRNEL